MSCIYMILILVAAASAAITEHRITKKLVVPQGDTVELLSLDYPNIPAAGTTSTWYLETDEGSKILLTCDDIWVAPSKLCRKGWFKAQDKVKTEKFCEKKSGYSVTSDSNELTVQIDLNDTTGRCRCKAQSV